MYSYEDWLQKADDMGFLVAEDASFKSHVKGLIFDNCIGLSAEIKTMAEKKCVLAEEIGHSITGVGSILSQNSVWERKQENKARIWSYNKLIGLDGIISSYRYGCRNSFEMADYLEVTEEVLVDSIKKYRSKYGVCTTIDNYIIYFEPNLTVAELNNTYG